MDEKYLVGWCPDCARITVVDGEDEATCGCGHELLSLTGCANLDEVSRAIYIIEGIKDAAFGREQKVSRPSLHDEAREARSAAAALDREDGGQDSGFLFMALLDDLIGDLDKDAGHSAPAGSPNDRGKAESDNGEQRFVFMLAPTPFGVGIRAKCLGDASAWLSKHMAEVAHRGFSDAVNAGEVGFHVFPLSGGISWSCCPNEDD